MRFGDPVYRGLDSGDERIFFFGRPGSLVFRAAVPGLLAMDNPLAVTSATAQFFVEAVSHGGNNRLFRLQELEWIEGFAKDCLESTRCGCHVPVSAGFPAGLSPGRRQTS